MDECKDKNCGCHQFEHKAEVDDGCIDCYECHKKTNFLIHGKCVDCTKKEIEAHKAESYLPLVWLKKIENKA